MRGRLPVVLTAAWFGLLAGYGHVAYLLFRKHVRGRMLMVTPDFIWLTPLADALIFSVLGILLILLPRQWQGRAFHRLASLLPVFLAVFGLSLLYPPLHRMAGFVLSLGIAFRVSAWMAARQNWVDSLIRRTAGWMALPVVLLGLGSVWGSTLAERRAAANLPPAAPGAWNLLFLTLDTVRARSLSLYGYSRRTSPQLERLAGRGIRFELAVAPAPWTLPSHASMFTGRFFYELSTDWETPLDATYPTLAEKLRNHGYSTAGFSANLLFTTRNQGIDRGFTHFEDWPLSAGQAVANSTYGKLVNEPFLDAINRKTAADLNAGFLRWLSRRDRGRPFFAFLNYFDAHEPYAPPYPYDRMFGPARPPKEFESLAEGASLGRLKMTPSQIQSGVDAYDGAIAYLDHHVGLLMDELARQGLLETTLVVITSDHGEQFGEHGLFDHGNSLYWPSLHVPLLIILPSGACAGTAVPEPVSLRDLPATLLELLGLKSADRLPGRPLAGYWTAGSARVPGAPTPVLSEMRQHPPTPLKVPSAEGELKSLTLGTHHYIYGPNGQEQLYDIRNDPSEERNLVPSELVPGLLDRFRSHLRDVLRAEASLRK